jgi:hypothetical protein
LSSSFSSSSSRSQQPGTSFPSSQSLQSFQSAEATAAAAASTSVPGVSGPGSSPSKVVGVGDADEKELQRLHRAFSAEDLLLFRAVVHMSLYREGYSVECLRDAALLLAQDSAKKIFLNSPFMSKIDKLPGLQSRGEYSERMWYAGYACF